MPNLVYCKILINKDYLKNNIDFMFKILDNAYYVRKIEYKRDKIILKFEMYSDMFNCIFDSKDKYNDNIIFEYVTEREESNNKIGKITIQDIYGTMHKKILNYIHILDDNYDLLTNTIEYTCICDNFKELELGEEIPEYEVIYNSEKDDLSFNRVVFPTLEEMELEIEQLKTDRSGYKYKICFKDDSLNYDYLETVKEFYIIDRDVKNRSWICYMDNYDNFVKLLKSKDINFEVINNE